MLKGYWDRFLHWSGWKKIFPLPAWADMLMLMLCGAGLIWVFANSRELWWPAYILYVLSAYSLTALCVSLPGAVRLEKDWRKDHPGVDGLLIGRGAMGNPWLFREIKSRLNGEAFTPPTIDDRIATALRHYDMLMDWKCQRVAVNEMRKHIGWYVHGMRGAAQLRGLINRMDDPDQVKETLLTFAEEAKSEGE